MTMKKTFKTITIFLVCFLFFLLNVNVSNAQSASLYFSYSSLSVRLNQTFSIKVIINTGGTAVSSATAKFTYPADKLQFISIDGSNSVFDNQTGSTGGGGTVTISRYCDPAGCVSYNGTGELATVNFKAIGNGSAQLSIIKNESAVMTYAQSPNNILDSVGTSTIYIGSLPSAGIFDKPKVVILTSIALILICLGIIGVLQYRKEKKFRTNIKT